MLVLNLPAIFVQRCVGMQVHLQCINPWFTRLIRPQPPQASLCQGKHLLAQNFQLLSGSNCLWLAWLMSQWWWLVVHVLRGTSPPPPRKVDGRATNKGSSSRGRKNLSQKARILEEFLAANEAAKDLGVKLSQEKIGSEHGLSQGTISKWLAKILTAHLFWTLTWNPPPKKTRMPRCAYAFIRE